MISPVSPPFAHYPKMPKPKSFTAALEQNQVLNRVVLDVFGWGGPGILFARNLYERIERALDIGSWLVAGVMFPLLLDRFVNQVYTQQLRQKYPKSFLPKRVTAPNKLSPLGMPFEWLDKTAFRKQFGPLGTLLSKLKTVGLKTLPINMAKSVLRGKIFYILLADMLLMATKGQGYYWGKNVLTEFLTGKKGFVGEFNYAQDAYLKKKSQEYEASKKKRMIASLIIGYGSAIALPLLIRGLLLSPVKTGKGLLGQAKRLIPAFNYSNTIYMSKWVLGWHTFFNWNIPSMLSSRDSHEFRENTVRTSILLGIYMLGDDIITGMLAKGLNRYASRKAKTPILSKTKGVFGMPTLMPLEEIMKKYGKKSLAYKLGFYNFWLGIVGICVAINSLLPLLNNYYTKQKVLREQALKN